MDKFRIFILLITVLLLKTSEVSGQHELSIDRSLDQYLIDDWFDRDGLAYSNILDVSQCETGYIWLASFEGLIRYDGNKSRIYNQSTERAIAQSGFLTVIPKHGGGVIAGSNGNGVYYINEDTISKPRNSSLLDQTYITALFQASEDTLWVGARNGLYLIDNGVVKEAPFSDEVVKKTINNISKDELGNIYISARDEGLWMISNNKLTKLSERWNMNVDRVLMQDPREGYIGSDRGLYYIKNDKLTEITYEDSGLGLVDYLIKGPAGSVFVGSASGLFRFKPNGTKERIDQSTGLNHNRVVSLFFDREGTLYVGTYRGGLNRLRKGKYINYRLQNGAGNRVVSDIKGKGNDTLLISTEKGFVFKEGNKITEFSIGKNPQQNFVKGSHMDEDGTILLATYDGIYKKSPNESSFQPQDFESIKNKSRTRNILRHSNGNLLVNTTYGVVLKADRPDYLWIDKNNGLSNAFIMNTVEDHQGRLWISTNGGGLYVYNNEGEQLKVFNADTGLAAEVIFTTLPIAEDNHVIATTAGLSIINKDSGKTFNFSAEHGLTQSAVFDLWKDQDNQLWYITSEALYRVQLEELVRIFNGENIIANVTEFKEHNSGRKVEFTGAGKGYMNKRGELFLPTTDGISVTNTKQLRLEEYSSPVIIENIYANNEKVKIENKMSFPAGLNRLMIEFTSLYLYHPEKLKLYYRLSGFDTEWMLASNSRQAVYTNLPSGNYAFDVKVENQDGKVTVYSNLISININPSIYETWWFYLLIGVLILGIGFGIQWSQSQAVKRRNEILKDTVKTITKDIEAQKNQLQRSNDAKDKLFSIISHDIKGPLRSMEQLVNMFNQGHITDKEFKAYSSRLESSIKDIRNFLENILQWSKTQMQGITVVPVTFDPNFKIKEIITLFYNESRHKELEIQTTFGNGLSVYTDENSFDLIIRNLLSNAIKFSNKGGVIFIRTFRTNDSCVIEIEDQGIGMTEAQVQQLKGSEFATSTQGTYHETGTGLGIMMVKEFTNANSGQLSINSEKNKGTHISLTLPLAKEKASITKE
ncbi:MAG: hypothetical protein LAT68_01685 [Cyclobacteriaceae bacterium]|nr:hypothetical protein [Cyclobacteriaceae bacterium]MCH8515014.1 hypothetical protein [Cyclobacteriaceae bacterium]